MRLTGYNLLEQVATLDPDFISGSPWRGKEPIVEQCGYCSEGSDGVPKAEYGNFHEAYEDARIFRDRYGDAVNDLSHSPQDLFEAFMYIFHEFPTVDVEAHVATHGLDSVIELAEELREYELADDD
jgi:hypothetical protein